MRTATYTSVPLGELVVTVFDKAAQYSADPQEVSRLATGAVTSMLRHMQRTSSKMLLPRPRAYPAN